MATCRCIAPNAICFVDIWWGNVECRWQSTRQLGLSANVSFLHIHGMSWVILMIICTSRNAMMITCSMDTNTYIRLSRSITLKHTSRRWKKTNVLYWIYVDEIDIPQGLRCVEHGCRTFSVPKRDLMTVRTASKVALTPWKAAHASNDQSSPLCRVSIVSTCTNVRQGDRTDIEILKKQDKISMDN